MSELTTLRPDQMVPYPGINPRRRFSDEKITELVASFAEHGVLQNLVVHDRGEAEDPRYWLVAGETRWRAAQVRGTALPCRIGTFTEAQALKLALIENLQRNDLTPIEQARGFAHYLELRPDLTEETLGEEFEVSQSFVSNRIRLLKLPESVQVLVEDGRLAPSYARDLLVPWTAESPEIANRFFSILGQQIQVNSDFNVPVTRAWLDQVIAKIAEVVKPEKPKPAPTRGKAAAAKKAAAKKTAPKSDPRARARGKAPEKPEASAPAEEPAKQPIAAPTTPTPLPATLGSTLLAILKNRGVRTVEQLREKRDELEGQSGLAAGKRAMQAIDALLGSQPEPVPAAETPAEPRQSGSFFSAVNALFGRYQLTAIAIAKPDGQVFVSIGGKPEHTSLAQVAPVTVEGPVDQIDELVHAQVAVLITQLTTNAAAA